MYIIVIQNIYHLMLHVIVQLITRSTSVQLLLVIWCVVGPHSVPWKMSVVGVVKQLLQWKLQHLESELVHLVGYEDMNISQVWLLLVVCSTIFLRDEVLILLK